MSRFIITVLADLPNFLVHDSAWEYRRSYFDT